PHWHPPSTGHFGSFISHSPVHAPFTTAVIEAAPPPGATPIPEGLHHEPAARPVRRLDDPAASQGRRGSSQRPLRRPARRPGPSAQALTRSLNSRLLPHSEKDDENEHPDLALSPCGEAAGLYRLARPRRPSAARHRGIAH